MNLNLPKVVGLKKGQNVIVLKLSNTLGSNYCGWTFAFRATLSDGSVLIPCIG